MVLNKAAVKLSNTSLDGFKKINILDVASFYQFRDSLYHCSFEPLAKRTTTEILDLRF